MNKINNYGQVFTPLDVVNIMLSLKKNKGTVLEPSCGDGRIFKKIKDCVGIELDPDICPDGAKNIDFFDFSIDQKFDTIIGNPPYVKYRDIVSSTKDKLKNFYTKSANLYIYFIKKSIEHLNKNGELIFIVPRDFIKATSAIDLNKYIYENGTITDLIDLGDKNIFGKYTPNCIIFRFEKNNILRKTKINGQYVDFYENRGQLFFKTKESSILFSDLFFVKVGAVSGADKCFESINGNMEFVYSKTKEKNNLKRMHYNQYHKDLDSHKEQLIKRRIKNFNNNNWYMWGRSFYESDLLRIYVNVKTRKSNPFFINKCNNYDGSVLAIFPKFHINEKELIEICNYLNNVNWKSLGLICGNRFLFSQKALENIELKKCGYVNKLLKKDFMYV